MLPQTKQKGKNKMADGISVTIDSLKEKSDEILAIDEKLDAASGSEDAGKRALANSLASEYASVWKSPADKMVTSISKIEDMEQRAAAFTGVVKSLQEAFKKEVDSFLEETVKARQADNPTETLSEDELNSLSESRKTLVEQFRALKNILDMFGQDTSVVPDPKKRTGSRGKRGPRVLTDYDYFIDGVARSKSQNSLSSIANTVCADLGWKTADLRSFLTDKGIDLTNPPAEFEVQLPTDPPKTFKAVKGEPAASDDDDEEVEEEEEVTETE
jgi:hypothetical protein